MSVRIQPSILSADFVNLQSEIERIGADRIIWGTDIPIVMLHWTYRQSLDYIRSYCDFIPDEDMELILGGNMARLLRLA